MSTNETTKLLTFQSWVTNWKWHEYAVQHPNYVPFPLIDRSPCHDPFFDHMAPSDARCPTISGLCRCIKRFASGDRFLYVTKVDRKVRKALQLCERGEGPHYLAVAAMIVDRVFESHDEASSTYSPRQYVAEPACTPYPPNLAFEVPLGGAAARECCILFEGRRAHTPTTSTGEMWKKNCHHYYLRQRNCRLRYAVCRFEHDERGRVALQLDPRRAPVLTPANWGGARMNINGLRLDAQRAGLLRQRLLDSFS